MSSRPFSIGLASAALLLAACGEEKVASYRVPREKDPEPPMAGADSGAQAAPGAGPSMADASVPTAGGDSLAWQAPAAWVPKAASAMRKGSYSVPGDGGESDFSITAFPGDVGGELANVNRWRGQVGLEPVGPEKLDASVSRFDSNGLAFTVVELAAGGGPGAKAVLGAIVPFGGSTWFFKLSGTGAQVEAAKPAVMDFLHTVRPGTADTAPQSAPAPAPSMADTPVPTAGGDSLAWQAPAEWPAKPASAMRKASYSVPGAGGESDLSITAFPGDVGGELANVNRWRGQVGLPPLGPEALDASVSRFSANGLTFTIVDLSGQGDPGAKAILGAIVPFGGSTWFFKLSGTGALVGGSRAAFIDFLHTVKAP